MKTIIKVENLKYKYHDFILQNINLDIKEGEYVSIIGRNGSGKSTLVRLLDGLLDAQEGKIIIDGLELNERNVWNIHSKIGIVFQNPDNQFVGANVEDDIAFGLENRQVPHDKMVKDVKKALKMVGMENFAQHEPSRLSGGQKQRVAIAGILAMHPQIIILDEATSMLDPEGRRKLLNLVQDLKQKYHLTVIAITHDINETIFADHLIILDKGKIIIDDVPSKIFTQHDKLLKIGLDLPFTEKLKHILLQKGIQGLSCDYLNEKEMAEQLWQLNLKM